MLPGFEHRYEDRQQSVGDAPQGAAVAVAGCRQASVVLFAAGIVLYAAARPIAQRIS